jgi:hypothetical protein
VNKEPDEIKFNEIEPPPVFNHGHDYEKEMIDAIVSICRIPTYMFYKHRDGTPCTREKSIYITVDSLWSEIRMWWYKRRGWHICNVTQRYPNSWSDTHKQMTIWYVK